MVIALFLIHSHKGHDTAQNSNLYNNPLAGIKPGSCEGVTKPLPHPNPV
jgi:hypothetical protein